MTGGTAGTTQFLYDGDELLAEYGASNNILRRYVHGPGVDEPIAWYDGAGFGTNRRRLQEDRHGSIVSVTDSAGNLIAINTYDEYGIPSATNLGRFQYTGQAWLDELGMYYYKARIYSPTLGRFMQTDPIGYEDQVNLYAYVGNDPMNRSDPNGQYQKGDGFTEDQWSEFDRAQQKTANDMERKANRLLQRAGKKNGRTADRWRLQAKNLKAGAANLRDTSATAPVAQLVSDKDWTKVTGRPASSQAHTPPNNRHLTYFHNSTRGVFGSQGLGAAWIIGHDGLHTTGLNDERGPNGQLGYKDGLQAQQDAFEDLKGTITGANNPENLMDIVYPK